MQQHRDSIVVTATDIDLRDGLRTWRLCQQWPQRSKNRLNRRPDQQATGYIDDIMAGWPVEACNETLPGLPAFELNPVTIAPLVGGGHHRLQGGRGNNPGALQLFAKEPLFPLRLKFIRKVLPLAATTFAEHRTRWQAAPGSRLDQFDQFRFGILVAIPRDPASHPVARRSAGDEDRLAIVPAETTAAKCQGVDPQVE